MKPYYTSKEIEQIVDSIIVCEDTRNQTYRENRQHIKIYCDLNDIGYKERQTSTGDIYYMIPVNKELEINNIITSEYRCVIELKNSIEEVRQWIYQHHERLKDELLRAKLNIPNFKIVVESDNGRYKLKKAQYQFFKKKDKGVYREYTEKEKIKDAQKLTKAIDTIEAIYGIPIYFINKEMTAEFIHDKFRGDLNAYLKLRNSKYNKMSS